MTIAELVRNVAQNALATAFNQGYAIRRDGYPIDPEGDP